MRRQRFQQTPEASGVLAPQFSVRGVDRVQGVSRGEHRAVLWEQRAVAILVVPVVHEKSAAFAVEPVALVVSFRIAFTGEPALLDPSHGLFVGLADFLQLRRGECRHVQRRFHDKKPWLVVSKIVAGQFVFGKIRNANASQEHREFEWLAMNPIALFPEQWRLAMRH